MLRVMQSHHSQIEAGDKCPTCYRQFSSPAERKKAVDSLTAEIEVSCGTCHAVKDQEVNINICIRFVMMFLPPVATKALPAKLAHHTSELERHKRQVEALQTLQPLWHKMCDLIKEVCILSLKCLGILQMFCFGGIL
jgi:hypothetical protein